MRLRKEERAVTGWENGVEEWDELRAKMRFSEASAARCWREG
jgi:hypothetical protein